MRQRLALVLHGFVLTFGALGLAVAVSSPGWASVALAGVQGLVLTATGFGSHRSTIDLLGPTRNERILFRFAVGARLIAAANLAAAVWVTLDRHVVLGGVLAVSAVL